MQCFDWLIFKFPQHTDSEILCLMLKTVLWLVNFFNLLNILILKSTCLLNTVLWLIDFFLFPQHIDSEICVSRGEYSVLIGWFLSMRIFCVSYWIQCFDWSIFEYENFLCLMLNTVFWLVNFWVWEFFVSRVEYSVLIGRFFSMNIQIIISLINFFALISCSHFFF
jgi:hypothetical protein